MTHCDYGFRIYNPGVGRFLSVDPLVRSYPNLTPYSFAENDVIRSIDLDGAERKVVIWWINSDMNPYSWKVQTKNIDYNYVSERGTAVTEVYLGVVKDDGTGIILPGIVRRVEEPISVSLPPSALFDYASAEDMQWKSEMDEKFCHERWKI